ncbi:uncharacterized protein LOC110980003 isoform X1 [Acanthaster planci]|uniref:Uncharacterized protein LOC110980003 isoform X1 n=1 Tax=Acanthaster planci TaxID=133434 RepID=A0A8B7YFD3_ACAPL|nr:uncharacterized protein LOC110980003 isoform X1 [Acanthaster planci]
MLMGPLMNALSVILGWRNCLRIISGANLVLGVAASLPFIKSPRTRPEMAEEEARKDGPSPVVGENREGSGDENEDLETDKLKCHGPTNDDNDGSRCQADTAMLPNPFLNVDIWLFVSSLTFAQMGWSFVIVNYSSFMAGLGLSVSQMSIALLISAQRRSPSKSSSSFSVTAFQPGSCT